MQCDDVIWTTINNQFCSFKVKTETQNFCRNEFNLTGICSKQSCPLANSKYATIKLANNELILYQKCIERSHLPKRLWQKTKLSSNYEISINQIDKELEYFPPFIIHKLKQRLTKLIEMKKRIKTLKKLNLSGIHKKIERRELKREQKAEKQANLESNIEKELLSRLKQGLYDSVYNDDEKEFEKALDLVEQEFDDEDEEEEYEEFDYQEEEIGNFLIIL